MNKVKSNFQIYCRRELEIAGLFDKDSDYEWMIGEAVMELVDVFNDQGHSGFSAHMVLDIFEKLSRYEPLTPLTGEEDEWFEYSPGEYQNKRCSRVFKKAGKQAYDIDGKVFRTKTQGSYTNRDSHVPITFPYIPKTEYVDVEDRVE